MEFLFAVAIIAAVFTVLYLRAEIIDLRDQQGRDARYYDWWMRSLEERKEDKPWVEREAQIDDDQ